eukprot:9309152-Pyramimonas_sp.AAC.1
MHIAGGPSGNMLDAGLSELWSANEHSNRLLDEALAGGGWAQNVAKQNTIVCLTGQGDVSANRRLRAVGPVRFVSGGVHPSMRVLGGQIHSSG